jgi:hypothetical protein
MAGQRAGIVRRPTWREYYCANRRGFFFILAPLWPLDVIDTLLKGKQHFIDQGVLYLPTVAITGTSFVFIASIRIRFTTGNRNSRRNRADAARASI